MARCHMLIDYWLSWQTVIGQYCSTDLWPSSRALSPGLKGVGLLSKCKRVSKSGKELNGGQRIFEWKIFTQKGVCLWIIHSKRVDIAITKSVITNFRAFYHSKMCCLAVNSLKEWKFTHILSSGWRRSLQMDCPSIIRPYAGNQTKISIFYSLNRHNSS